MKDKKPIYYLIIISIIILITLSPVLAEDFKVENKVVGGKINNQNVIVAKAAMDDLENDSNINYNNNNNVPKTVSQLEISKASVYVNNYVTKYKKLPNKVNIGGYDFSIPEYTYLLSKTINYKQKNNNADITVKHNVKNPLNPSGSKIKGKIYSKQYYVYAKRLSNFIDNNNQVPNYVNSKLGKMQYQTAVFGFNKIVYWSYTHKGAMPSSIMLNVPKCHKMNTIIPKYTRSYSFTIIDAMGRLANSKNFIIIESNFSYGPTKLMYNNETLISIGRCSCGKAGDYHYHEASFKNYCPYCKVLGVMVYEEANKYPEGLWVCVICDADFCLVTGKEHIIVSPKYLTPVK